LPRTAPLRRCRLDRLPRAARGGSRLAKLAKLDAVSIAIARNNLAAFRLVSASPWLAADAVARQIREPCETEACALPNSRSARMLSRAIRRGRFSAGLG
jgi:hypothetical protein